MHNISIKSIYTLNHPSNIEDRIKILDVIYNQIVNDKNFIPSVVTINRIFDRSLGKYIFVNLNIENQYKRDNRLIILGTMINEFQKLDESIYYSRCAKLLKLKELIDNKSKKVTYEWETSNE